MEFNELREILVSQITGNELDKLSEFYHNYLECLDKEKYLEKISPEFSRLILEIEEIDRRYSIELKKGLDSLIPGILSYKSKIGYFLPLIRIERLFIDSSYEMDNEILSKLN